MRHVREVSKFDFTWIFRKSKIFSVCFKIICTACRTVLIQSALCSPDLGGCFRYSEHVYNMRRNFSRWLKSLWNTLLGAVYLPEKRAFWRFWKNISDVIKRNLRIDCKSHVTHVVEKFLKHVFRCSVPSWKAHFLEFLKQHFRWKNWLRMEDENV